MTFRDASLESAVKQRTQGEETFATSADQHLAIIDDPAFLAQISSGLHLIRLAESRPGILSSPQDRIGSLIQILAAEPAQSGVLLDSGGEEVQFDSHDALGWVGSLWEWLKQFKNILSLPEARQTPPNLQLQFLYLLT